MTFVDTALVVIIILFLIFIVWSRVMGQRMVDTFKELVEMIKEVKK